MTDSTDAVYFEDADYASIIRRVLAFLIDAFALFLILGTLLFSLEMMIVPANIRTMHQSPEQVKLMNDSVRPYRFQLVLMMGITFTAYHIFLRTSRNGTLGYRIAGIRLVNPQGQTPDMRVLGRRFMLAVPFCGACLLAYLTCVSDPRRQAFHDRWSGTWLVRSDAEPGGAALVEYQPQMFAFWVLRYRSLSPAAPGENGG